jgi:putative oxidoreductase
MSVPIDALRPHVLFATRLIVAGVFLWHGIPKAFNPAGAIDKFVGFGLPGFLGPVTGIVEVLAATLLILGTFYQLAALALVVIIAGAIVTVQLPAGLTAGLERDALILAATLLVLTHGPGSFALRPPVSRK